VQRRPDIRQAEDQLHAATANVGVAEADFFPRVTLMGSGMLQALEFADLNSWAARSYSFGPSITLPIFEGGRLTSSLDLRNEQEKEAAIQFRKTVLTAFHDVDNALTAFRSEQQRHVALVTTLKNDHEALELAVDRYKNGLSDFLTVLTDEQNTLNAETQAVQSRQAVNVAMVQLYKALGGGWEKTYPDKKYR
jgi:outer membrane protein TolC